MNELAHFVESVLIGACSKVARLIKVEVLLVINKAKDTDVKLSTVEKQRSLDVLLNNNLLSFLPGHQMRYHVLPISDDFNTSPSVFIFWFDNPNILRQLTSR